jgi:sugar transferase (PEP-CTERM system associated)
MSRIFGHYVPAPVLALAAIEGAVVFGSVFVGYALPILGMREVQLAWGDAAPPATALAVLIAFMLHIAGLYDSRQAYDRRELFLRLVAAFGCGYLLTAALGYFVRDLELGRKAFVLSFMTAVPTAFVVRLIHHGLTANTRHRQKVLLLGSGRQSELLAKELADAPYSYELIGHLDVGTQVGIQANGLRCLGSIGDLDWISEKIKPDVIVVALEERRGRLPVAEIVTCKLRGIEVDDWPTFYEKLTGRIPLHSLRPSWLVFADGFNPTRLTRLAKRAMDILVSLAACAMSLPVMLAIAAAIKLDSPGPIFFRQERMGRFGRIFSMIKFRSMRPDAHRFAPPAPGEFDARITRVGHFLRRTRLDELPQIFNVLLGDMSLVGPRPEWTALVSEFKDTVPFYLHRLAVKPGITGWAQVNNPYGATIENTLEKLQYDLYYIKNTSIFLDLLILLQTIQIVLFTRGSGEWTNRKRQESITSVSCVG